MTKAQQSEMIKELQRERNNLIAENISLQRTLNNYQEIVIRYQERYQNEKLKISQGLAPAKQNQKKQQTQQCKIFKLSKYE